MLPAFLWTLQVVSKRKGGPQALIVSTLYVRLSPNRVVGMKRKLAHCIFAIYKDRYSNKSGIHFSWLSKRPLNSDSSPPKVLSGLPVRGQFSQVCLGTHGMSFYWKSQLFYGHQSLPKDLSRGLPANSLRAVCTQNMTSRVKSILSPGVGFSCHPSLYHTFSLGTHVVYVSSISEVKHVSILKGLTIFFSVSMAVSLGLPSSQEGNSWCHATLVMLQRGRFIDNTYFPETKQNGTQGWFSKCAWLAHRTDY